jgi:HlyD family secretion protein
MIAEPSRTDEPLASHAGRFGHGLRTGHRVAIGAILALAAAGALAWWAWASAEPGVRRSALRLAVAEPGTLVRDAQVGGRTVAAASPTLVAPAAGHVTLAVRAGDAVAHGLLAR